MDPLMSGLIGLAVLVVLLFLGVHIGVALGLVGIVGMSTMVGLDAAMSSAADTIYYKVASFDLITIPLFILMGYLASAGGISSNVFKALNLWVGRFKSGIGVSTVMSCTAFGAVTGSSLVTASVFSSICAPEMRKFGYDKKIAYGICASGGMIGMLIPPSILMVIYGVLAGESIGRLLIAGVTPGILLMLLFSLAIVVLGIWRPNLIKSNEAPRRYSWREKFLGLLNIWQVWFVALVIFGGIFGGIFNPTEAAAVASTFLFLILLCSKFRQSWRLFVPAFKDTASTSAMIFLVMSGAAVFSHFLVLTGVTNSVAELVLGMELSNLALVCVLAIVYGILGCVLDSISMLCITIPIFGPIVEAAGLDPIWYAVVVVMAIESGLITPPVGLNVYGAYAVAEKDVSLEDIFMGVMPFFLTVWVSIALLIFFPVVSTWLPELMLGK